MQAPEALLTSPAWGRDPACPSRLDQRPRGAAVCQILEPAAPSPAITLVPPTAAVRLQSSLRTLVMPKMLVEKPSRFAQSLEMISGGERELSVRSAWFQTRCLTRAIASWQ